MFEGYLCLFEWCDFARPSIRIHAVPKCLLLFCSIDTQYACIIYEGTEQFTCSVISPNAKFTLLMMKDLSDFLFDEELSYNLISLNVLKICSLFHAIAQGVSNWISAEKCEGSKMKLER